jgi:hypothetical protein
MCCKRPLFCVYLGLNCELVLRRFSSLGLCRTYPLLLCIRHVYVSGELWQYWQEAFPRHSICDMFVFVKYDIDNERVEFTRSLAVGIS